jgi:dimethylaniline monooxygenase (N-oxide forming)
MPIAAAQAQLIGDLLLGRYALPPLEAMRAEMERDRVRLRRRFVASARHTMEIDFDRYLQALARERKTGERRARRAA